MCVLKVLRSTVPLGVKFKQDKKTKYTFQALKWRKIPYVVLPQSTPSLNTAHTDTKAVLVFANTSTAARSLDPRVHVTLLTSLAPTI
jgi:hypothetical protein